MLPRTTRKTLVNLTKVHISKIREANGESIKAIQAITRQHIQAIKQSGDDEIKRAKQQLRAYLKGNIDGHV